VRTLYFTRGRNIGKREIFCKADYGSHSCRTDHRCRFQSNILNTRTAHVPEETRTFTICTINSETCNGMTSAIECTGKWRRVIEVPTPTRSAIADRLKSRSTIPICGVATVDILQQCEVAAEILVHGLQLFAAGNRCYESICAVAHIARWWWWQLVHEEVATACDFRLYCLGTTAFLCSEAHFPISNLTLL
jgi:hypothetical protein